MQVDNDGDKKTLIRRTFHDTSMIHNHLSQRAAQLLHVSLGSEKQQAIEVEKIQAKLQSRRESCSKMDKHLQHKRRQAFRRPEEYLFDLSTTAALVNVDAGPVQVA